MAGIYAIISVVNLCLKLSLGAAKGSIEAGKDADFLVFDNDLLAADTVGFSYNLPTDVYFDGKKITG